MAAAGIIEANQASMRAQFSIHHQSHISSRLYNQKHGRYLLLEIDEGSVSQRDT
jgi:hypothetical protein